MASKAPAKPAPPKDQLWAEIKFPNIKGQTLEGQIPLTLAPGKYKTPDLENLTKQNTDWFKDWLLNAGFTLKGDLGEKMMARANDVISHTALLVPDVDPTNVKMRVMTYFLALAELKDEMPEMKDMIGSQKEKALQIGLIGGEIILGKLKSMDELPPVYPEAMPIFKALFHAAAAARETIPDFLLNCKPFVKATDEGFISLAFVALDYIMADNEKLPEDTFKHLHRYESGVSTFFELAPILVGISLPDNMRTNILFARVMDLASSIYTLVEDVFKVRPNVEKNYGMSLITVKARRMPLKDAFAQTIQTINEQTINFIAATQRLRILYPKNKRLDKFLSVIESVLDGHIYFAARNKKYGDVTVKIVEKKGSAEPADVQLQSSAVRTSSLDAKSTWG